MLRTFGSGNVVDNLSPNEREDIPITGQIGPEAPVGAGHINDSRKCSTGVRCTSSDELIVKPVPVLSRKGCLD